MVAEVEPSPRDVWICLEVIKGMARDDTMRDGPGTALSCVVHDHGEGR